FVFLAGLTEKSVRLGTACVSLVGVGAVYGLARRVYGVRPAWATFAVFATTPLWYLHSRTGFEYVVATSFFLAFALCYLLALREHGAWAIPAAISAAAAFYSYTPARGWVAVGLTLLAIINLPEHLRRWRVSLGAVALLALLLAPALYVQWNRPDVAMKRLEALGFREFRQKPVADQVRQIASNYAQGLDPRFWYTWSGTQNSGPMERHVVAGLPQLPPWTAPFAAIGLGAVLLRLGRVEHRTLLALVIASLSSASLVGFNNARAMPVGVLLLVLSLIGLGRVWSLVARRAAVERVAALGLAAALAVNAVLFQTYVFDSARYAYADYGFYGVQMGAPEVFRWIARHHQEYRRIRVSHGAFNAAYIFIPFYLRGEAARKTTVDDFGTFCRADARLPADVLYVASVGTFDELRSRACPVRERVVATIPDLRGQPLFRMSRLERAPDFADWLLREQRVRETPVRETVRHRGGPIEIEHSALDIGEAQAIFDGDLATLARSAGVNPARFLVQLPGTTIRRVRVTVSHTGAEEIAVRTRSGEGEREWGVKRFSDAPGDVMEIDFESPVAVPGVTALEVHLHVTNMDRNGFVHVNEIDWD
ncbi:MAG: hypothetical protein QOD06_1083, partial [Candidatus Binatota bacterium]|nr:hypothetical protein [Candidatus Binatota bacterium]